jgi:hypothetical protein
MSPVSSPTSKELLRKIKVFDMDEEDLGLLRAEGIKSLADFHRIKNVDALALPSGFLLHVICGDVLHKRDLVALTWGIAG